MGRAGEPKRRALLHLPARGEARAYSAATLDGRKSPVCVGSTAIGVERRWSTGTYSESPGLRPEVRCESSGSWAQADRARGFSTR